MNAAGSHVLAARHPAWSLSRSLRKHRRGATAALSVGLFLILWQVAGSLNIISSDMISYPTQVVGTGVAMTASGELAGNALVSLLEIVEGFVPAVAIGLVLGLLMARNRRLRYLLEPLLMAFYTAPYVALIPIIVLWFGIGTQSKVAIVFLGAIFPVLMNTTAGMQQVDPLWVRAARAFGATPRQVTQKVIVPGSLPAIMAGLRLGLGRGLIGMIIGELYVATAGLGHLMQVYDAAGQTAQLMVLAAVTAIFGFVCVSGLRWCEERAAAWRSELAA